MGDKDCKGCEKHGKCKRHMFWKPFCCCLLLLLFLILLTILIIYLVLRPTKPRFSLQDVSVSELNLSTPDGGLILDLNNFNPASSASRQFLLTSTMQVTVSSRNPNDRIGVYYDRLDVYASYKQQQITLATAIPPNYQGHNDVTVWSPNLVGISVPVSPYLCAELTQDRSAGILLLNIRLDGRVRWKVGTWISGRYHIHVNCPAFVTINSGVFRFQQIIRCSVDV